MVSYIALIHKDANSDYGVSFPDLPGCVSAGRDLDAARAEATEALALHLAGLCEDGEPYPEPSSLEAVMDDAINHDGVAILVDAPSKSATTVEVAVSFSERDLRDIDSGAAKLGLTRSGFLARAARSVLIDPAEDIRS